MIDPSKLFQLESGQRRRKLALTFGALERDIAGIAERGMEYRFNMPRSEYTKALARIVLKDPALSHDAADEIKSLLEMTPLDERRLCNVARNHLLAIIGTFPAEWDLIIAPHKQAQRDYYRGISVYAEDIRSPFNLGSIFRTAEAMGAEKVYLSPLCVDPAQQRAVRSAMGCIEVMGYERCTLEDLPDPVFVLETGGTPIDEFVFPRQGVCILGSEELGASPNALHRASYGCVSIPMMGIKASLNVGVAYGILMQKWIEAIKS